MTFVELYTEHNQRLTELIGKGFTKATLTRHETSMKHVVEFLQHKYNQNDILLKDITPNFIKEYEHYLRTVRNCANNTTVKYIRNMGKILRLGEQKDIIKKNPMNSLKYSIQEIDKIFLTDIELDLLIKKEFATDRLSQVRDVFAFCCFTGLAFIDVKNLRQEDLSIGTTGEIIIRKQRQKSGIFYNVPLLPVAKHILEKYRCKNLLNGQILPVPSNVKMNAYLKETAVI